MSRFRESSSQSRKCFIFAQRGVKLKKVSFYSFGFSSQKSHRGCPDGAVDHKDCGKTTELTRFRICPSWLSWNEWTECNQDEKKFEQIGGKNTENYYYTFKRTRSRECNTFDDQCMTEPGLLRSTYEEQMCGMLTLISEKYCRENIKASVVVSFKLHPLC